MTVVRTGSGVVGSSAGAGVTTPVSAAKIAVASYHGAPLVAKPIAGSLHLGGAAETTCAEDPNEIGLSDED